ncbi:MAG: Transcriptional regulatory protein yycF [Glaciihabitans sp.]|jgi:DNA-binding response OmpR family regulator|nr:Transcriptional regulatory protein yycF [Glaciihabitans sp.]MDQ1569693.1 two-component system, OmpR family, response regulator [Actinomycetota bacterium]
MTSTIVIADDDRDIRELVRISLTRAGFEVVADVDDGNAALAAILALAPDVAILDVAMPGLTGLEVCRLVREQLTLAHVNILLLSAAADDASRSAGLTAGATDYLTKPFSPRELVARLATMSSEEQ